MNTWCRRNALYGEFKEDIPTRTSQGRGSHLPLLCSATTTKLSLTSRVWSGPCDAASVSLKRDYSVEYLLMVLMVKCLPFLLLSLLPSPCSSASIRATRSAHYVPSATNAGISCLQGSIPWATSLMRNKPFSHLWVASNGDWLASLCHRATPAWCRLS